MTDTIFMTTRQGQSIPESFSQWRSRLDRLQVDPVVAIAGSRGKTSVLRAFESIIRVAGRRHAAWTDSGVEIEGDNQIGELTPWHRALTRLGAGGLDLAVQEIDWATLHSVVSPQCPFPIVAVTNLCVNSDACLATPETVRASKALDRIRSGGAPNTQLVMNASDVTMLDKLDVSAAGLTLIGASSEMPALRHHAALGGSTCWVSNSAICVSEDGAEQRIIDCSQVSWLHDGDIPFAVQNALLATGIARACGISIPEIAQGLAEHLAQPELMPGSFNVFETNGATVIIDRPAASWFLRPALRAAGNLGMGRGITVTGPMEVVADDDLVEVGRLLGRHSSIVVTHGDWSSDRTAAMRSGAASNDVPPIFMHLPNERRAIQQALGMLSPERVLVVLAEDAPAAVRIVASEVRRGYEASPTRIGAA